MLRPALAPLCALLLLASCAAEERAPQNEQAVSTPAPSPQPVPTPGQEDLGGWAPPEFEEGGLTVEPKEKFIAYRSQPDADATAKRLKTKNPVGQRLRLLVMRALRDEEGRGWFKVLLPVRPNGTTAWVESSGVRLISVPHRIEVDLSDFVLRHYRNGRLVNRFKVGIGTRQYPTPVGTFFVWALVAPPDKEGPYGSYALGLSGFSPVLSEWPGGGRSAIHGTTDPGDRGKRVSHGCVRVYNADIRKLRSVPMGAPVIIRK